MSTFIIKIKKTAIASLLGAMSLTTGCSTMGAVIEHKDLQASTQQSETIFLDPVSKNQQTVHVSIKNTSDQTLSIEKKVKASIESHGFKVVSNPNKAHYLLQANILKVGTMSVAASKEALGHGYGSVISGVGTAAAVGALGGSSDSMLGAGLVIGLADMAASSFIKNVNYSIITDIQLSERVDHEVRESMRSQLLNGSNANTTQKSNSNSHFQRYRTRVISNAEKVNLKFSEARPALERGLVQVLGGLF